MEQKKASPKTRGSSNQKEEIGFDLDAYIAEQSKLATEEAANEEYDSRRSYRLKNMMLLFGLLIFTAFWYNDWQLPAFNSSENSTVSTAPEEGFNYTFQVPGTAIPIPPVPNISIPPIPPIPDIAFGKDAVTASPLDITMSEYLLELKELGYLDNEISTFTARQLYQANVPISYLEDLNAAGFLDGLSYVAIQNYFLNNIPISYLQQLKSEDFYEDLSFVAVSNYYRGNVSIDYLRELHVEGYLSDLSFVYVSAYYNAGVTPQFLDRLKEMGLYEDLNYLDVVELYRNEGE